MKELLYLLILGDNILINCMSTKHQHLDHQLNYQIIHNVKVGGTYILGVENLENLTPALLKIDVSSHKNKTPLYKITFLNVGTGRLKTKNKFLDDTQIGEQIFNISE